MPRSANCAKSLSGPNYIGATIALSHVGAAGVLSAVACGLTILMMVRCIWELGSYKRWVRRLVPLDILIASIILSDLVQGIAGSMNYHWVEARSSGADVLIGPYVGSICSSQGALKIIGESTSAIGTLAITVVTFLGFVLRRHLTAKRVTLAIVVFAWLYASIYTAALLGRERNADGGKLCTGYQQTTDRSFAPLPFWCWINTKYRADQIASEYVWLWSAGIASILLWVPLFIIQRTRRLWPFLAYPVAYTLIVLPLSIVRFRYFLGHPVSDTANLTTQILFHSLGWVNVILFFLTRRTNLIHWQDDEEDEEDNMGVDMDKL